MPDRIDKAWVLQCAALVIPFTAILHQAVFYPHNCLLNRFGDDYDAVSIGLFLTRDPSLPWAVLAAFVTYLLGSHARFAKLVRLGALPFFLGFLPFSLWIWDVPFAGRPICNHWHDGRLVLPVIGTVRSLHLYALGALLTTALTLLRLLLRRAQLLGDVVSHDRA
jgi:hypothetical protein